MEFQNQPFRDLKERVVVLERQVEELQGFVAKTLPVGVEHSLTVRGIKNPIRLGGGGTQPQAVREEQDDAGGKPFFKTVGAVQEKNEQGS